MYYLYQRGETQSSRCFRRIESSYTVKPRYKDAFGTLIDKCSFKRVEENVPGLNSHFRLPNWPEHIVRKQAARGDELCDTRLCVAFVGTTYALDEVDMIRLIWYSCDEGCRNKMHHTMHRAESGM